MVLGQNNPLPQLQAQCNNYVITIIVGIATEHMSCRRQQQLQYIPHCIAQYLSLRSSPAHRCSLLSLPSHCSLRKCLGFSSQIRSFSDLSTAFEMPHSESLGWLYRDQLTPRCQITSPVNDNLPGILHMCKHVDTGWGCNPVKILHTQAGSRSQSTLVLQGEYKSGSLLASLL